MLALLVVGLGSLVWWSLPREGATAAGETATTNEDPAVVMASVDDAGARGAFARPPRAMVELAILTNAPDETVQRIANVAEIGRRLDVRHCGGTCEAVKKHLSSEEGFEVEVTRAEDLLLPPKDTLDLVASALTPEERESVHARRAAVVVRTEGAGDDSMPARTAFAVAGVLAEALDGLVYDEVARRIEPASAAASLAIRVPLGEPIFSRRHIVVQLFRQDDGTARLGSLGMLRFGSPDLALRGANMSSGPLLAEVMNAAASQLAAGKNESTLTVTLEDVARTVGKRTSDLATNPAGARPAVFDLVAPERVEGDPDNEIVELVPRGGSSREAWDSVVAGLFGIAPSAFASVDDQELADVAKRARRELPRAIQRFSAGEGDLFVKGPFPIPPEARAPGGAANEMLWIAAASCSADLCTGVLSNEPSFASNIALGKTTSVRRDDVVDWLLRRRDGGTSGGESIKALSARGAK